MKNNTQYSDYINYRGSLQNTYEKLMSGTRTNIVYFGGSITHGFGSTNPDTCSWRALSTDWFLKHFSHASIHSVCAAIGESGTFLGTYRLERDVLSQSPDLLFIEFAINDHSFGSSYSSAALQFETIIREVRTAFPKCDIVTVLTTGLPLYSGGKLFEAAQAHYDISASYGISTIDVGGALWNTLPNKSEEEWNEYFIDLVHPNDNGYRQYYMCIEEFLTNSLLIKPYCNNQNTHIPLQNIPLQSNHLLDGNRRFKNCTADILADSTGFSFSPEIYHYLPETPYLGYIYAESEGAEFVYTFYGTEIAIYCNFYSLSKISVSIDGGNYIEKVCNTHAPTIVAKGLTPEKHKIKISPVFCNSSPNKFKIAAIFTRDESLETKRE